MRTPDFVSQGESLRKREGTGLVSRIRRHNEVLRETRDPRQAIAAYCRGNKWLTENAKAVGNWPR